MTISIRLDAETEAALRRRIGEQGVPLSDFVRDAIREKLASADTQATPYSIGAPLFGRYASGETDRSARRKEIVREKLRERHCR